MSGLGWVDWMFGEDEDDHEGPLNNFSSFTRAQLVDPKELTLDEVKAIFQRNTELEQPPVLACNEVEDPTIAFADFLSSQTSSDNISITTNDTYNDNDNDTHNHNENGNTPHQDQTNTDSDRSRPPTPGTIEISQNNVPFSAGKQEHNGGCILPPNPQVTHIEDEEESRILNTTPHAIDKVNNNNVTIQSHHYSQMSPTLKQAGKSKSTTSLFTEKDLDPRISINSAILYTSPYHDKNDTSTTLQLPTLSPIRNNFDIDTKINNTSLQAGNEVVIKVDNQMNTQQRLSPDDHLSSNNIAPHFVDVQPQITSNSTELLFPQHIVTLPLPQQLLYRHILIRGHLDQTNAYFNALKSHVDVLFLCMKEMQGRYNKLATFVGFGENFATQTINTTATVINLLSVDQQALLTKVNTSHQHHMDKIAKLDENHASQSFPHPSITRYNPFEMFSSAQGDPLSSSAQSTSSKQNYQQPQQQQSYQINNSSNGCGYTIEDGLNITLPTDNSHNYGIDGPYNIHGYDHFPNAQLSKQQVINGINLPDIFQSAASITQHISTALAQFQDQHLGVALAEMIHYRKLVSTEHERLTRQQGQLRAQLLSLHPTIFSPWQQFYTIYCSSFQSIARKIAKLPIDNLEHSSKQNLSHVQSPFQHQNQSKLAHLTNLTNVNFPLQHQILSLQQHMQSILHEVTRIIDKQRRILYELTKTITYGIRRIILKSFQFTSIQLQTMLYRFEQSVSTTMNEICIGLKHHAFPTYFTNPLLSQYHQTNNEMAINDNNNNNNNSQKNNNNIQQFPFITQCISDLVQHTNTDQNASDVSLKLIYLIESISKTLSINTLPIVNSKIAHADISTSHETQSTLNHQLASTSLNSPPDLPQEFIINNKELQQQQFTNEYQPEQHAHMMQYYEYNNDIGSATHHQMGILSDRGGGGGGGTNGNTPLGNAINQPQQSISHIQEQYQYLQAQYYQQQALIGSTDVFSLNLTLPSPPNPSPLACLAILGLKAVLSFYTYRGQFGGGWVPVTGILTRSNHLLLFDRTWRHHHFFIDRLGYITLGGVEKLGGNTAVNNTTYTNTSPNLGFEPNNQQDLHILLSTLLIHLGSPGSKINDNKNTSLSKQHVPTTFNSNNDNNSDDNNNIKSNSNLNNNSNSNNNNNNSSSSNSNNNNTIDNNNLNNNTSNLNNNNQQNDNNIGNNNNNESGHNTDNHNSFKLDHNTSTHFETSPTTTPLYLHQPLSSSISQYLPNIISAIDLSKAQLHITKTDPPPNTNIRLDHITPIATHPSTKQIQHSRSQSSHQHHHHNNNTVSYDPSTLSLNNSITSNNIPSYPTSDSTQYKQELDLYYEKQHMSQYMLSVTIQDASFFALKSIYKTINLATSTVPLQLPQAVSDGVLSPSHELSSDLHNTTASNNVDILVKFLTHVHND